MPTKKDYIDFCRQTPPSPQNGHVLPRMCFWRIFPKRPYWASVLTIVRAFFWVNLTISYSFFSEASVIGVFEVPEFESSGKTESTIFGGPRTHFCGKFVHNSRTVGRTGSVTSPSFFSSNFTLGQGTFPDIFKTSLLG